MQAVSEHQQRVEGVPADSVVLELPVLQPDTPVPVIELFLR